MINQVAVMVGSQKRYTEEMTPNQILTLKRPWHIEGKVEEHEGRESQTVKECIREEMKEAGRKVISKEVKKYKEI